VLRGKAVPQDLRFACSRQELQVDDFDRDPSPDGGIGGFVNDSHAARPSSRATA